MTETLFRSISSLSTDTAAFWPELFLCATIVLLLFVRMFPVFDRTHLGWLSLLLSACGLWAAWNQWTHAEGFDPRPAGIHSIELFSGLLVFDDFSITLKLFLFAFTTLVVLLGLLTGVPDREDSADFFVLLFGSVVGMSIMASANHLLMVFIGVEMTSVPSYALAGFFKGKRRSSEAALKYVVYGGGASGIMLYGISLIAGNYGTGYLPDLVRFVGAAPLDVFVLLGLSFIMVGLAFKLSAFPFHFWCPDVFEGAPAEVAGFLSVASKGAALALLARLVYGIAGLTGASFDADAWSHYAPTLVPFMSIFAVITMTFGNFAAYAQTNLKRLLAYSTIAHAGFMLTGLATLSRDGVAAVVFYLWIYLLMNLGAFTVVAFLRNQLGSEDLRDMRGLVSRSPILVVCLGACLLSLLGLPPFAGFMAKFQVFSALYDSGRDFAAQGRMDLAMYLFFALLMGGVNSVISLFYYVKVLKVMVLERTLSEVEGQPAAALPLPAPHGAYVGLLALSLLVLGIWWNPLAEASSQISVRNFLSPPQPHAQALAEGPR